MHDYYTGLDPASFRVTADTLLDGAAAGENLAPRFKPTGPGIWQWKLDKNITQLPQARLTVEIRDRQGNTSRIERAFSVGEAKQAN